MLRAQTLSSPPHLHLLQVLAYMYFDGEGGLKIDKPQACVLFKLAAVCGSREAARVLGWVYNTGQYGH